MNLRSVRTLLVTTLGGGHSYAVATVLGQFGDSSLVELTTIDGKITKETKNAPGDVDGWQLEDGTVVHFPPHAYNSLKSWVKAGDKVSLQTKEITNPEGEAVNEVVTVQKDERLFTINPPAPKPPKVKEEFMKISGNVASFHSNPHGDVDGVFLDDDTQIKFPPHMGQKVQALVSVGDEISVQGNRHITPKGDLHVRADVISANGQSVEIDHPKGPKHGPAQEDWMTKSQADEVIKELRQIRKLLENRP